MVVNVIMFEIQEIFLCKVKAEHPSVPCFLFGHSTGGAVVLKVKANLYQ